jgi:quercetin dioxygenase-like cupin family protein
MWNRDRPHDRREALFGGRASVRVWNLAALPMLPFTAMLACELEPGGRVGEHLQEHYPESLIVLEGRGEARLSGTAVPLAPGSVLFLPLGETLAIDNGSASEPLRYLIIKAAQV